HGARIARGAHAEIVFRRRWWRRRWWRWWRWRRRWCHVDPHTRVIPKPHLPVDVIAQPSDAFLRSEVLAVLHRKVPAHAAANEEPAAMLPRQRGCRTRQVLCVRDEGRQTAVDANQRRARQRGRIFRRNVAVDFERAPKRAARRKAGA